MVVATAVEVAVPTEAVAADFTGAAVAGSMAVVVAVSTAVVAVADFMAVVFPAEAVSVGALVVVFMAVVAREVSAAAVGFVVNQEQVISE
jgi:hypothetical protein